ncbi:MAG: hypothetical protein ACKOPO_08245 [Novosphingobium sp.]
MFRTPTLAAIVTAARAGALDHAEALLREGRYDERHDDPSALAVAARLKKDRALRLDGEPRRAGLIAAAALYARADALRPQPFARINVASLHLLAGDESEARRIARDVLAQFGSGQPLAETPYFLAAIRAEALLVCGDPAAEQALDAAMALDGGDWTDRAATRRQLRLIAEARGLPAGWIDAHRPPASLNFAGHLGVGADGDAPLRAAIDAELDRIRPGFAFGALAAGADIVIAEQLLARGCELHVVLPTAEEDFIAQSVTPYGADWLARYHACIDAAASVMATAHTTGTFEPLATALASEVAMGSACRNARQIDGEAVQLLVVDEGPGPYGEGVWTAHIAERWRDTGRQQAVIRWPRTARVAPSGRKESEGRADRRLVVLLKLGFAGIDDLDDAAFADALDRVLTPFRQAAAGLHAQPMLVLPAGNARFAAFATSQEAWDHARAALELPSTGLPVKIAGHYGMAHWLDSPPALVGRTVAQLDRLFDLAVPGVLTVSEAFASSLFLRGGEDAFAEPIGEVDDVRILAITAVRGGLV